MLGLEFLRLRILFVVERLLHLDNGGNWSTFCVYAFPYNRLGRWLIGYGNGNGRSTGTVSTSYFSAQMIAA